ncbi:hypothetical protein BGW36DRAFT_18992 [Talaromyces proteolyticus]|uniref:MARVEL domain-containing protein n=1 Tax=Talaromyces proteolyticus TaxID=1131652 RepID=A0AAD4L2A4_9EURO|nr:uncharacterized protein BGW36DRAFT_18992 [Talaromyces proteolyticus]KAH8705869.1 hypothetical protein BGW36DRAFT_18992 [Talaromyces proteolyticus]
MSDATDIIRPILFVIRLALWISAVIVMGLAAWVVTHVKGYRAVFTLVIAVLTTAFYIPSFFTSCMSRNRGYMLPLDIIFYALWLSAFIFVAQTDNVLGTDNVGCNYFSWTLTWGCTRRNSIEAFTFLAFFWTLCGMCLEIANIYLHARQFRNVPPANHPEKPTVVRDGPAWTTPDAPTQTTTGTTARPASAAADEQNVV